MKTLLATLLLTASTMAAEPVLPLWEHAASDDQEVETGLLLALEDQPADEPAPDLPEPPAGVVDDAVVMEETLPEAHWPAYFAARPEKFLIDPQKLLGPVEYRERLAFLDYHASDSTIDLFIYVIGGNQEIPGEVRQEEMTERLFSSGRPAVVVLYFLGAPQRAVMHLSPTLSDLIPAAEQRRALESSVIQALKETDAARQIETFLVQMSIRIYWMERMLGVDTADEPATAAVPVTSTVQKSGFREFMGPHLEKAARYRVPASFIAGVLLFGLVARFWLKYRARHVFPDFEVEPRLGGSHAAGVGAVISFASTTVPPATQRDPMPDYLRRAR